MGKGMPAPGKRAMSCGFPALSFFPKATMQILASGVDTLSKMGRLVCERMGPFVFLGET